MFLSLIPHRRTHCFCRLSIPSDWASGEGSIPTGANGTRRTLAWFPPEGSARDLNVSVLVTNVSFEFTNLGETGGGLALYRAHLHWIDCSAHTQ